MFSTAKLTLLRLFNTFLFIGYQPNVFKHLKDWLSAVKGLRHRPRDQPDSNPALIIFAQTENKSWKFHKPINRKNIILGRNNRYIIPIICRTNKEYIFFFLEYCSGISQFHGAIHSASVFHKSVNWGIWNIRWREQWNIEKTCKSSRWTWMS